MPNGSRHEQFCTALLTETSEPMNAPREQSFPPNQTAGTPLLEQGRPNIRRVEGSASKTSRKATSRATAVEDDQDRQRGFDEDYTSVSLVKR